MLPLRELAHRPRIQSPEPSAGPEDGSGVARRERSRRRRLWRRIVLAPLVLGGCYTYTPVSTLPEPGTQLALELNDQGRVGLASSVGHEIARVEGSLVDGSDTAFVVRVSNVLALNGRKTMWGGDTVKLRREYVKGVRERKLAKRRTALFAAGVAVLAGVFIATRDLFGLGGEDPSRVPPGGPPVDQ